MINALVLSSQTAQRMNVVVARTNNVVFGVAKAMMIAQLKEQMANGIAHFIFQKKNGELREAWGTLNKALVYKHTNGRGKSREMYATTAYFDVEASGWRSFRWENIVAIY